MLRQQSAKLGTLAATSDLETVPALAMADRLPAVAVVRAEALDQAEALDRGMDRVAALDMEETAAVL